MFAARLQVALLGFFGAVVSTWLQPAAMAQTPLMSPAQATRLGLVEAWRRPLTLPAGAQSIVDQKFFVYPSLPVEYVEVVEGQVDPAAEAPVAPATEPANTGPADAAPGEAESGQPAAAAAQKTSPRNVLVRIRTDQLGRDGQPIGKEEAQRRARQHVRVLKHRGIQASITSRSVPSVRLFTLADDGTLECQDAETGEPIWLSRVGSRWLGYAPMGVNEEYLSVLNGGNLLTIDAMSGDVIESIRTNGVPISGSTNAGGFALVPTVNGAIEGYPLEDSTDYPFREIVAGRAMSPPVQAPGSSHVAWATDRGFVYVMEVEGTPSVLFRLDVSGLVTARVVAASGDRFFFASDTGQVYALRATRTGEVLWSQPYGEPFYNDPLIAGEQLLLRSAYGNLYSVDVETGMGNWNAPVTGVDELLGVVDGKVFARLRTGLMTVLELETGKRLESLQEIRPRYFLVNRFTNRLYLISDSGTVQCLRPVDSPLPAFNEVPEPAPVVEKKQEKPKEKPAANPFDPGAGEDDPFDPAGADPFGAGEAMPDPFATGDEEGSANPFGGELPF